ncbi:hypothetical protein WME76_02245 [Sorangium sp. So ce119]|uniref:hypothetical protein n=1 Tax=Sorangium sp. So ce119 TaxID=3133279 RepID=UPI003F63C586
MLLPDLQQRLSWWQPRFGLRDWKIAARYVDDLHLDGQPVWGLCRRLVDNRTAEILIRTPTNEAELAEVEETLVHELLHCLLAPLGGCEPASVAAEENAAWTLSPLLVQLGQTRRGRILARAMSRAGVLLAAGRTRSSGRTRMDPKLIAMIKALLNSESIPPDQANALLAEVVAAYESAGASDGADEAAEVDDEAGAGAMAEADDAGQGGGAGEGGNKPFQRATGAGAPGPSVAVEALMAAYRARTEAPRRSREERLRELRLPKDIADIASKLPDAEFDEFARLAEPLARQSGPVRRGTQGEGSGGRGGPQGTSREAARARLPLDQREGLSRTFGSRAARPTVARTRGGELVMSHVGNVPEGSAPLGGNGGK